MAISRFDIDSGVDRLMFVNGQGHLIGLPTRPGTSSTAITGVPTNGIAGFAPGANFYNFKGGPGTALYVNIGTVTSAQWINVDSPDGGLVTLAATTTLTALIHSGRTMLLNASGGFTTTLPAATGTGNIYRFLVQTVSTTGYVLACTGSDVFKGNVQVGLNSATPGGSCQFASSTNQNYTLNGTTKGGVNAGDWFNVQDYLAGVWSIQGMSIGSGTLATPFS